MTKYSMITKIDLWQLELPECVVTWEILNLCSKVIPFNLFHFNFRPIRNLQWCLHLFAVDQDCNVCKNDLFVFTTLSVILHVNFKNEIFSLFRVALGHLVLNIPPVGLVIISAIVSWTLPPAFMMLETAVTTTILIGTTIVDQPVLAYVHNWFRPTALNHDLLLSLISICLKGSWEYNK